MAAIRSGQFSSEVESYAKNTGESLLSSCIQVAESLLIDEEKIPRLISESLRQKLEIEAISEKTIKVCSDSEVESLSAWM